VNNPAACRAPTPGTACGPHEEEFNEAAANAIFDPCSRGFALRDPRRAEVTRVVLDNGPASADAETLGQQLAATRPCVGCPSYTVQVAIGFGRGERSRIE